MIGAITGNIILAYHRLLRMHPAERGLNVWMQEEGRAERNSNFIRVAYTLAWLVSTALHAKGNSFWPNISNVGIGGLWFAWSVSFQIWLMHRPYRTWFKYLSTSIDMVVITFMIFLYHYSVGPSFCLKAPTYMNYFCCLILVSLRFNRRLTFFGGGLALGLYVILVAYLFMTYDIPMGTNYEHATTEKIHFDYLVFQFIYMMVFTFMTYIVAVNVRRLVELRAVESEMTHRAQERAVVAAGVAHEIKNPLEGIYGAAQLLQEEGKGNPRFIQMILKDSVRLNETVQQFLRFSRPFSAHLNTFDVVQFVRNFCAEQNEIASGVKPVGQSNRESIPLEFASSHPEFMVQSDEEGLRQILLNLVQNAKRYQPHGVPVRVVADVREEVIEIRVQDEGEGVPESQRAKLFEPFFTTSTRGTGLGLAISRKIARELGGDLYYEPANPGTHFVLVVRNHPGTEGGPK